MAQQEPTNPEQVVLGEEVNRVRLLTLNRPRQLNVLSCKVVSLLAEFLEKWEKDDSAELVIVKGAGRSFSAGGDLKMFYEGRSDDSCLEVVYKMYWLCYHIHTYRKTQVALVHGIVMGGGGALTVPSKFSVVTDKTVFAVPEASIGHHTDCSFSYILSHLPGHLGEFLALTGARLNGKEMIAAGLATHFVPSEKLLELEEHLLSLNTGNENEVKMAIQEFSVDVKPDDESILNKFSTIDKCFSKETVEDIIKSFGREYSSMPFPPQPHDICTIMYTSGTSGDSKGVILTQVNHAMYVRGVELSMEQFEDKMTVDGVYLSFLPLAHILDRMTEEFFFHKGSSVGYYQGDINALRDDLMELKPTLFAGIPRVFEFNRDTWVEFHLST